MAHDIRKSVEKATAEITALRRELHQHPEIRFEENWTSDRISRFLSESGIPHSRGHANGTGIVARLEGRGPQFVKRRQTVKTIVLRADMDALEMQERSGVAYASTIPNRMHACGHDGHMAILCGTAKVLSQHLDTLRGTVKFIFQPAEELGAGGRCIVAEGLLDDVDAAFALHTWHSIPLGKIGIKSGPMMASADWFSIDIEGRGCHGADPGAGIDPVVVAAHVIIALQTIVAREINPWDAAVITVGRIQAGVTSNIIPENARLEGTFRALSEDVRDSIAAAIRRIAENTASAFRATASVTFGYDHYAPLINDPAMADRVRQTVADTLGPEALVELDHPSMGAEDFAFYLEKVPGAIFYLGNYAPGAPHPIHSPYYIFNDDAIPIGMRVFCDLVHRSLE
jgi:amidohydrolase